MKLVMDLSPVNQCILTVVNGNEEISKFMVPAPVVIEIIDAVFKDKYIEAVQLVQPLNAFNQKFVDYIEENYKNVEVFYRG